MSPKRYISDALKATPNRQQKVMAMVPEVNTSAYPHAGINALSPKLMLPSTLLRYASVATMPGNSITAQAINNRNRLHSVTIIIFPLCLKPFLYAAKKPKARIFSTSPLSITVGFIILQ